MIPKSLQTTLVESDPDNVFHVIYGRVKIVSCEENTDALFGLVQDGSHIAGVEPNLVSPFLCLLLSLSLRIKLIRHWSHSL